LKLGFRSTVLLIALILALAVFSAVLLKSELRLQLESGVESELLRNAKAARELILASSGENSLPETLADRLGEIISARVTVIAADGRVLGDSELSAKQISEADNHGYLPEVLEALSEGQGRSKRYSATLRTEILYVAVPFRHENYQGVVRIAKPLHEVSLALKRLQLPLFLAAVLGVGTAILISIYMSHFMSGRLRNLVENARMLAEGRAVEQGRGMIAIPSKGELGRLAGSINRMALELERLMSTLAWERDRFEAVLEGMSEGVLALDKNRHVTHINSAALSLLGLSEAPTGRMLLEVVRSPDLSALISKSEIAEAGTVEFELPGKKFRRLKATVTPQRATGGTVVVFHDITELRRLETVRKDFIANVSHELRTPVSVIQANAETLLASELEIKPRALEFLEALQRNAERLSSIIADLLDISQIESGQYIIEPSAIQIEEAVRKTLENVQARAEAKHLAVEADLKSDIFVLADAKALDQILFNLVDNAVKYTPEGGHIVVRAYLADSKAHIEICDDGYGIESEHRDRVFERFYRADAGRSREMGGTGLGLSIVKNLTEAMNGQAGLSHGRPRGSVFWVTLPAGRK